MITLGQDVGNRLPAKVLCRVESFLKKHSVFKIWEII